MSQNELLIIVATFLISAAIMIPVGYILRKKIAESKIQSAENEAKRLLQNASIEELTKVTGITENLAKNIKKKLSE